MSLGQVQRAVLGRRWGARASSVNGRIFSAALTVGAGTLAVKAISMAKDVLAAARYGAGDAQDAFLVALLLPTYLINVIGGPISVALVPIQIEVRATGGPVAAERLFRGLSAVGVGLLSVLAVLLALVGPRLLPLLSSGFPEAKLTLVRGLFYVLVMTVLLQGVTIIWEAALIAARHFRLVSLASAAVPLASIGALLVGGARWGIYALAVGAVVGLMAQLSLLGWGLRIEGLRPLPRWFGVDPAMRRVLGQYLPTVTGAAILSSMGMIDQAIAASLAPGSVAALGYGYKLVAVANSVGTMALGTAVLPYFSEMAAAKDWRGMRHSLATYGWPVLLVTIPFVGAACFLSESLVAILFQHGAFTSEATRTVARVQAMYLLQLPFVTLGILFAKSISSLQANHLLLWGNIISFLLNITLDLLLVRTMGVAGIALSTTLVYAVAAVYLGMALRGKLKEREGRA